MALPPGHRVEGSLRGALFLFRDPGSVLRLSWTLARNAPSSPVTAGHQPATAHVRTRTTTPDRRSPLRMSAWSARASPSMHHSHSSPVLRRRVRLAPRMPEPPLRPDQDANGPVPRPGWAPGVGIHGAPPRCRHIHQRLPGTREDTRIMAVGRSRRDGYPSPETLALTHPRRHPVAGRADHRERAPRPSAAVRSQPTKSCPGRPGIAGPAGRMDVRRTG